MFTGSQMWKLCSGTMKRLAQGRKETRRIRGAARKSGITISTPLRRRYCLVTGLFWPRASSPIPQAAGTGKRGLRALTLVYPTPPPPPSSAAHLAYLVFWKSSSLARVNITAVPSAPDPGLERGNAGSRCRRRSRLEGRRILRQLHGP